MVHRWLLCDYGQVLSTAPPPEEWDALRRAAGGLDDRQMYDVYWQHRPAYDRADLTAAEYWRLVLGGEPAPDRLAELQRLDVAMWLHPEASSVAAAVRAASRGWRLAILSNAPVEVAASIADRPWLAPFERRFFSCDLRAVKPEPAAYAQALAGLGAQPEDVVFFDDRPDNVEAAAALGMAAVLFRHAGQIDELT